MEKLQRIYKEFDKNETKFCLFIVKGKYGATLFEIRLKDNRSDPLIVMDTHLYNPPLDEPDQEGEQDCHVLDDKSRCYYNGRKFFPIGENIFRQFMKKKDSNVIWKPLEQYYYDSVALPEGYLNYAI